MNTHLGILEDGQVGSDVVLDAIVVPVQHHTTDKKDDQHHVGEGSCHVHHLNDTQQQVVCKSLSRTPPERYTATGGL